MRARAIITLIICVLVLILAIVVASTMAAHRRTAAIGAGEQSDESEDDLPDIPSRGERYSTLRPHQAREVESALRKHFGAPPRRIMDATAHVGGDTIHFMQLYPKSDIIAIEVNPSAFKQLSANVSQVKESSGHQGEIKLVNGDAVTFLQNTSEKVDLVYLDPPRGGPECNMQKSVGLHLFDAAGKKWDIAAVANLVLDRGIAPCIVMKAPFNFRTAEFSAHLGAPLTVYPIGRSRARHSSVSCWLLIADKDGRRNKY
jgi:hypothetical protein